MDAAREGPRLEVAKHLAAERRVKRSLLTGKSYEGREEDLALIRRKHKELGQERLKKMTQEVVARGGGGGRG
jgi:hypothetical protein